MDRKGDPSKQPPECAPVFTPFGPDNPKRPGDPGTGTWSRCPNIKSVAERWESETYACEVCGERYTLYDDEMR